MTREQIEYLHRTGKMPDYAYYQLNGMSPEYNLWEQHQKIHEKIKQRKEEGKRKEAEQKKQEEAIEKSIDKEVRKQLDKIFSKR